MGQRIKIDTLKKNVLLPSNFIEDLEKALENKGISIESVEKIGSQIIKGKPTQNYQIILSNGSKIVLKVEKANKKVVAIFVDDVEIFGVHKGITTLNAKNVVDKIFKIKAHNETQVNVGQLKQVEKKELEKQRDELKNEIAELEKEIAELEKQLGDTNE